jgi:hypothetical protein
MLDTTFRPRGSTDGARVVADNVGFGAHGTADYVARVRAHVNRSIEWFDTDLPWLRRDAREISTYRKPAKS